MANFKILVPSGLGDFSWLYSKLVTTPHNFHIEYIGGKPDRLTAFLSLLPKDRILSFKPNDNYYTRWDENNALVCVPRPGQPPVRKAYCLNDLRENELCFLEINTWLEAGNRIEEWNRNEIPNTNFHYPMNGTIDGAKTSNYFIVNFSSYGTKKAWGYFSVEDSSKVVKFIFDKTGWIPLFIGGTYDDYTVDIYKNVLSFGIPAISLVGNTPDLTTVVALLQQSRFYFGACSGIMCLSNILNVPVATYYPGFDKPPGRKLAGMWHDPAIPYLSLFWTDYRDNCVEVGHWLSTLV